MAKYIVTVREIRIEVDVDQFQDIGAAALPLLRDAFEEAHVEILGRKDTPLAGWYHVKDVK